MGKRSDLNRPGLGFRVGITGTRVIHAGDAPRIEAQVRTVLDAVRGQVLALGREPAVRAAYGIGCEAPWLRLLSPLAPGADQLAARIGLGLGYTLHVPLPFAVDDYVRSFDTDDARLAFRELLAIAGPDQLTLDGDVIVPERAYEAVGRLVVRNADLLIAVWDGRPSRGRGGTADIVRYAAASRVPVVWIHAENDVPPAWIDGLLDLTHPPAPPTPWADQFGAHAQAALMPPETAAPHAHSFVDRFAGWMRATRIHPYELFLDELERRRRWIWQANAMFMRLIGGAGARRQPASLPKDPAALFWFERYRGPDSRAAEYADRYRSSYVWIFLLGTLSVLAGAAALVGVLLHPHDPALAAAVHAGASAFAVAELALLLAIFALVLLVKGRRWHERSIEYRLLAELYRKQMVLVPFGWSLSISAVRSIIGEGETADRAAWVAWLFAAQQRCGPLPAGSLLSEAGGVTRRAIICHLLDEQLSYHEERDCICETASLTLERLGICVFLAVIACVTVKIVFADAFHAPEWAAPFAWAATVLPAVSAAFVGIRAYAELQLLAAQSRHMVAELERARRRVDRIDLKRSLASQDLGGEAAAISAVMLQDLEGWTRLFRIKTAELG